MSTTGYQEIGEVWGVRLSNDPIVDLIRGTYEEVQAHIARVEAAVGVPCDGPIPIWSVIHTPESYSAVLREHEETTE